MSTKRARPAGAKRDFVLIFLRVCLCLQLAGVCLFAGDLIVRLIGLAVGVACNLEWCAR